ncbi:MAG: biopolymer transporter ExbD [Armatimonadetes bacterium]|nr:biopolymer transporter ExbD [Armatimonadota bacterium]
MAVKAGDGDQDMMAEINITPFTDVLLVLLIIFMIAATAVMQDGLNINLPKAITEEEANNSNIVISITRDKTVYVGSRSLTQQELVQYLARLKRAKNTDKVIIMADATVPYGTVIDIMDKAKDADLTQIALATKKDEKN